MRLAVLCVALLGCLALSSAALVWVDDADLFEVNDAGVDAAYWGGVGAGGYGMGMGASSESVSSGYGAAMAYDTSALSSYTATMKDVRTAAPIYAAPLTNTQLVEQPIIKPRVVTQPIVQRQVIKQPIVHTHYVNQPVLRNIYTQPIIQPKIIQTTTVQPQLTQQPILQPKIFDQTIVQPKLEEHFLQNQPIVRAAQYQAQPATVMAQQVFGATTQVNQPMHEAMPTVHNTMMGQFSAATPLETQMNAAIEKAPTQVTNKPIIQQLPAYTAQPITKQRMGVNVAAGSAWALGAGGMGQEQQQQQEQEE